MLCTINNLESVFVSIMFDEFLYNLRAFSHSETLHPQCVKNLLNTKDQKLGKTSLCSV